MGCHSPINCGTFWQIFECSHWGLSIYDWVSSDPMDFRLIYANQSGEEICGFPIRDYVGRLFREAFPSAVESPLFSSMCSAVESQANKSVLHLVYEHTDGSSLTFSCDCVPLPDKKVALIYLRTSESTRAAQAAHDKIGKIISSLELPDADK